MPGEEHAAAAIAKGLRALAATDPTRAVYLNDLAQRVDQGKPCLINSATLVEAMAAQPSPAPKRDDLVSRYEVMEAACFAVADALENKDVSVAGALIDAINAVPSINPAKRPVEESMTRRMMAAQASEAAERGEPYNERAAG